MITAKVYVVIYLNIVLVAQSSLTLCTPMDHSLPSSSIYWISQARIPEWVPSLSPGDLPDPGIEPGLLHCRQILYTLSHQGSPICQLYLNVVGKFFKNHFDNKQKLIWASLVAQW